MKALVDDLERLLFGGVSVLEYLNENRTPAPRSSGNHPEGSITLKMTATGPEIQVRGRDKPGLLLALAQAFYLMDINVIEANITTDSKGKIANEFRIDAADERFRSKEFQRRLVEDLKFLL